jgi:hypothetical protein
MADFALIALPGAYRTSTGALIDSYLLARDRVEQVFAGAERMRMETALKTYSVDGRPVRLSDGSEMPVDGGLPATRLTRSSGFRASASAAAPRWTNDSPATRRWSHGSGTRPPEAR